MSQAGMIFDCGHASEEECYSVNNPICPECRAKGLSAPFFPDHILRIVNVK